MIRQGQNIVSAVNYVRSELEKNNIGVFKLNDLIKHIYSNRSISLTSNKLTTILSLSYIQDQLKEMGFKVTKCKYQIGTYKFFD